MRIALVLGAGGPVGFAFHAGALAALADAGWDPRSADLIVGTSMGAVTAGLLRAGMAAADLYARVEHTALSAEAELLLQRAGGWPNLASPADAGGGRWGRPASPQLLRVLVANPRRIRLGLLLAGLVNAGTVETSPIADVFDRLLGQSLSPPPTWICAVDLDSGARSVFGRPRASEGGDVGPGLAIAASCAVPSHFAPVEIDGHRYVDGGVHSPANTDLVGELVDSAECPDAVVVSLPMGMHGRPGRRGVDLPGRKLNHIAGERGLAPLVAAGVPVLWIEPTARELEVMHYNAFDHANLPAIAASTRATLGQRIAEASRSETEPTALAMSVLVPPATHEATGTHKATGTCEATG